MEKLKMYLIIMMLFSATVFAADAVELFDYNKCADMALQNSNTYKAQHEKLKQADLARLTAISGLLPTVSINYDKYYTSINSNPINNSWSSEITAIQPIFHGFEKIMNVSQTDNLAVKESYTLKETEKTIKENTASAFFALALAQAEYINTQKAFELMSDRYAELKQREVLGKSRLSELYSVQSSAAVLAAQLELAKNNIESAADSLSLIIGTNMVAIIQPVENTSTAESIDATLATENEPSVKAAKAGVEAQGRKILQQQALFLPAIDLVVSRPLGGTPYTNSEWLMGIRANWVVFEGGAKIFDTVVEYSKEEGLKQQFELLFKTIKYQIKSRQRDFNASVNRVVFLKDAFDKSEKSFKLMQKDYRYGMATNIEVIQAMTDMINVKKSLDNEIIAKEKNRILLQIASEVL